MIQHVYIERAKKYFVLSLGCFLVMGLLMGGHCREVQEALARRIAPAVLRFHVLAESNGRKDQEVKLEVRSLILDYVREQLSPEAGRDETMEFIENHTREIETAADRYLMERGMDYRTSVEITNCYFPARAYGRVTFPCGYYDAVRVTLGSGQGHNWWCVIYPQFCFLDVDCETETENVLQEGQCVHDDSEPDILRQILQEDDYLSLKDSRPHIAIRFRLQDLCGPLAQ